MRAGQLGRQLVAARLAVGLVLGGVDGLCLGHDLARDLLVIEIGVAAGVSQHLGAVDRDHPDPGQPGLRAEPEHRAEQAGQRVLVALHETRDRRVIGPLLRRDHAVGDVLLAGPLDRPRRPHPARVGVEQQRHHHRRLIGRSAVPVGAIDRVERRQVQLLDGVDDKPREMTLRQPLTASGGIRNVCSRSHAMKFCPITKWS